MIRAVIFDYGEVLCTQDRAAHQRLIALTGVDRDTFERLYWRDRRDYDLGHLDGPAYWTKFARDAGRTFTPAQIDELIATDVRMWTSLNPPMVAWATALQRAGVLTAILSNMGPDVLRTMLREFAWLANFNQLTWSCDLGIAKPDPAIYALTCEKLSVRPSEALFLDDKIENIRGAEAFGLLALQFSTAAQLHHDLAARGLLQDFPQPGDGEAPPSF
ncbi:MAG: HAD family phosphatase [Acidobacteriaceae bacterium]